MGRSWYIAGIAVLALIGAIVLARCGGDEGDGPVVLPPITATPTPTPSPTTTAGMDDWQQVKFIYLHLRSGYNKAQTMPKKKRRKYLSQWMTDPALSSFVVSVGQIARKHQRTYGRPKAHIFGVSVNGAKAHVDDCSDESTTVVKNTTTGKVIRKGKKHIWLTAKLKRTPDGWRVNDTGYGGKSCKGR